MYKSRLQEYCQKKAWKLPEYAITKEGLDHCPQFKATVVVDGTTYFLPDFCSTSKEAQNLVAKLAFDYLTNGTHSASSTSLVATASSNLQQPFTNEIVQATSLNSPSRDEKKLKDMSHLYKSQLQTYTQKRNLVLPEYITEREGPPHAIRFKSKVTVEGKTYESQEYFSTLKNSENAAAKIALMSVSSDLIEEEDPGFFKNLLQELAQKDYSCLPEYNTTRSGPSHLPKFVSVVEIKEESFRGPEAKTKKLAEMYAAKVAYTALVERVPQKGLLSKNALVKPEGSTKTDRDICAEKVEGLAFSQEMSPNDLAQSPAGSSLSEINEVWDSPDASSSKKKVKVYPRVQNMTLPRGVKIMHQDEKWVAVTRDSIHGNA